MGTGKVLILGGSSYIGKRLLSFLGVRRSIGTYCRNPIEGGVYFDALAANLGDVMEDPQAISHAVILLGDTKPDSCAANPQKSRSLNVASIKRLLKFLKQAGIKPVFASTESVFDGSKGDYVESDVAAPVLTYGCQKLEIENHIQREFEHHVIVRLALCYGVQEGDGTILSNWLAALIKGEPIQCAYDQVSSPIYVEDAVQGIVRLIDSEANGVFHLSGPAAYSKLALGEILAAQVRERSPLNPRVVARSIRDFPVLEPRPLNVSMRPDKLVGATGLKVREVPELCSQLVSGAFQC